MPLKRIRFTPKAPADNEQRDKVVTHQVRLEVDGAPQGDPKNVRVGDTADFGEIELAEGRHEAVFTFSAQDAAGNTSREHRQTFSFEAKDTTPPAEPEDGEVDVEDVLGTEPAAPIASPTDTAGPKTIEPTL